MKLKPDLIRLLPVVEQNMRLSVERQSALKCGLMQPRILIKILMKVYLVF